MIRHPRLPARLALAGIVIALASGTPGAGAPSPAEAAPLAAPSLGLIPASGPPGMSVTAVGSSWTFANNPYSIFWETKGGTQLGTFSPDGPGSWSTSITIPSSASAGAHTIVACEGYTTEFEQCASATFTVVLPSPTTAPTRTRTPTLVPALVTPATRTSTPTVTNTPLSGCIDGVSVVSPRYGELFEAASTMDLVLGVTLGDSTVTRVLIHEPERPEGGSDLYTQWPDPLPGTTVEAVPSADDPYRWTVTVRDYPLSLGLVSIPISLEPTCAGYPARGTYHRFYNGPVPTATPRPDVCGGLGLPSEATVIDFEFGSDFDRYIREYGVRFEGSLRAWTPPAVSGGGEEIQPRSGSLVGISQDDIEFGSTMLPIRMAFDRPLSALGVFVGMAEPWWTTEDVTASLIVHGYRAGSDELVRLGADSTSFPAAPTSLIHCLRFSAEPGDIIARAMVEYTDAAGNSVPERRLIDDLTIVHSEDDLPADRPPTVEITSPTDGSLIPGTTVNLRATVREDREIERTVFQIDGGEETEIGASHHTTDPTAYFTGITFSASLLEPGVPHVLSVVAFDSIGQSGSDTVRITIPTPVPTVDIQAIKMEVVQVVQCLDNRRCEDNAVPMIVGKPTWVRVYVRAEGGTPERPISGRLCRGRVATCDTGLVIPLNEILPDGDADPSVADRGNLEASLNFFIPPTWVQDGPLELTAFVNYAEREVDELVTDNNVVQASVRVVPPRSLTVMFTPVTADGITAEISEMWNFADWLARVFPVSRITAVRRANLPGNFDLSDGSGGGCGRSWNRLMDSLQAAYSWGGRGTAYQLGLVPGGAMTGGIAGCGQIGGPISASITSGGTRWGPVVGAQELGHNFGRLHATTCGDADSPDPDYPRRDGLLDDWGIDLVLRQLYPRDSSYDYMGYCGGGDNTWTSIHTYLALLRILPVSTASNSVAHLAAPFRAEGEPSLIGGGQISPSGFILERGFYRASLAEGIVDGLPDGPYTVELRDAIEFPLYARDFNVIELSNSEPTDEGYFQIILPDLPETAAIVFLYDGDEIGRVSASANAPQVSITEPVGGEDWGASGAHTIAWQASDGDGDSLRFNVQYSTDGGSSWEAIDLDLVDATSVALDSADLPGGNLIFRVLASDGLQTTESATTVPVLVSNKPPLVHLASPTNGDWLPAGEAAIFRGYATDPEDVVVEDDGFRWSSSLDGELGRGPTLWGLPLSVGDHEIALEVTDRAGETVRQTVTIRVGGFDLAQAGTPPSPLIFVLGLGGLLLLVGAGVGALLYFMRSRPARR